jgi:hypothetical protein
MSNQGQTIEAVEQGESSHLAIAHRVIAVEKGMYPDRDHITRFNELWVLMSEIAKTRAHKRAHSKLQEEMTLLEKEIKVSFKKMLKSEFKDDADDIIAAVEESKLKDELIAIKMDLAGHEKLMKHVRKHLPKAKDHRDSKIQSRKTEAPQKVTEAVLPSPIIAAKEETASVPQIPAEQIQDIAATQERSPVVSIPENEIASPLVRPELKVVQSSPEIENKSLEAEAAAPNNQLIAPQQAKSVGEIKVVKDEGIEPPKSRITRAFGSLFDNMTSRDLAEIHRIAAERSTKSNEKEEFDIAA